MSGGEALVGSGDITDRDSVNVEITNLSSTINRQEVQLPTAGRRTAILRPRDMEWRLLYFSAWQSRLKTWFYCRELLIYSKRLWTLDSLLWTMRRRSRPNVLTKKTRENITVHTNQIEGTWKHAKDYFGVSDSNTHYQWMGIWSKCRKNMRQFLRNDSTRRRQMTNFMMTQRPTLGKDACYISWPQFQFPWWTCIISLYKPWADVAPTQLFHTGEG